MDEPLGLVVNRVSAIDRDDRAVQAAPSSDPDALTASRAARVWSTVNRNPGWVLGGVIALYLVIAIAQASTKLLWGDELITLSIAQQGSLTAIWRALAAGADPNPPLSHWLVMESVRAFGQSALAVRLPSVLCGLLAIVGLWAVLRRWVCPGYAAVGVLAFMATRGFDYAYDARSYAPLMGFSMASLALWLIASERRGWPRAVALAGMTAALALAVASNYYGVLAFFPIAVGEIVRARKPAPGGSRLRPAVWLTILVAALPLLAFRPLIWHNLAEFGPHAWNHPQAGMISDSYLVLVEGVFWPVLGLAIFAGWRRWRGPVLPDSVLGRIATSELAALAVLLLYPVLGFAIALAGHGMISPRCVVPVCCGFGIAAALLAQRIFGVSARAGVILLSIALAWVVARESACAFVLAQQRTAFFALRDDIARQPQDRLIAVSDSLFVLPLAHYSSDALRARIVFPIDFDAIHRSEPDDSGEQNLWAGRDGIFPVRIEPYDSPFVSERALTVIARPGGWLTSRLARSGFHLTDESSGANWRDLGGVFTPMAHEETRVLQVER